MHFRYKLKLLLINAEDLEPQTESQDPNKYQSAWESLASASGLIVPGGFGKRGRFLKSFLKTLCPCSTTYSLPGNTNSRFNDDC